MMTYDIVEELPCKAYHTLFVPEMKAVTPLLLKPTALPTLVHTWLVPSPASFSESTKLETEQKATRNI